MGSRFQRLARGILQSTGLGHPGEKDFILLFWGKFERARETFSRDDTGSTKRSIRQEGKRLASSLESGIKGSLFRKW